MTLAKPLKKLITAARASFHKSRNIAVVATPSTILKFNSAFAVMPFKYLR